MVPTDFSDNAEKALLYAMLIAQKTGAHVNLIHAFSLLENVFIDRKAMRDAYNEEQKTEKTAQLTRLVELATQTFINVSVEPHLFSGPTEDVLVDFSQKTNADLIVMGTQGANGIAEVLVGSVTAALISKTTVPLLAIPAEYEAAYPGSIVLAVQGFNEQINLVKPVAALAEYFDIPVKTLMFEQKNENDIILAEHALQLEAFNNSITNEYPKCTFEKMVLSGLDFEESMQHHCNEHGVGILAMITHKRGFFEQFYRPSITKKMAYRAKLPLLAIPAN